MSRRTERMALGGLGFLSALIALVVGVQVLTGDNNVDVAANSLGPASAEAASAASDGHIQLPDMSGSDPSLQVTTSTLVTTSPTTTPTTAQTTSTSAATSTSESSTTETSDSSNTTSTSSSTSSSSASTSSTTEATSSTVTTIEDTTTTSTSTSSSTTEQTTTTVVAGLTGVEQEILRLTNELRANPDGPLKRVGPTPECVLQSDDIEFDPVTGHPKPVPPLALSQPVSLQMARDWSQQMAAADAMSHRSGDSQNTIYAALGIDWSTRGENVAWAFGYAETAVARLFFNGWRESAGHYCNMMSGGFSHIGVGHIRTSGGKDFATQNFYRPR